MNNKKIVLGTVQFGLNYGINNTTGKPNREKVFDILDYAWSKGIDTLDTAVHYGDAIAVIGAYHSQSTHRFKVISKFQENRDLDLKKSVQTSLDTLQIEQLEGLLCHSFDFFTTNLAIRRELQFLKKIGVVKKIGVSIYSKEQLAFLIEQHFLYAVDIIQLPYNLLDNAAQKGQLIAKAKEIGIEIHTRSVFLQGLFFRPLHTLPQKIQALSPYLKDLHKITQDSELPMHQLALSYALANENIEKVLIGVDSIEQLQSNLETSKNYPLQQNTLASLDRIKVKELNLLQPVNW
jgi:aryl-alcohol dehydrogenase-like predicted oxidoreductase